MRTIGQKTSNVAKSTRFLSIDVILDVFIISQQKLYAEMT